LIHILQVLTVRHTIKASSVAPTSQANTDSDVQEYAYRQVARLLLVLYVLKHVIWIIYLCKIGLNSRWRGVTIGRASNLRFTDCRFQSYLHLSPRGSNALLLGR